MLCEADGEGLRLFHRLLTGFEQTHGERFGAAEAQAPSRLPKPITETTNAPARANDALRLRRDLLGARWIRSADFLLECRQANAWRRTMNL
jgi:hypothetical protein